MKSGYNRECMNERRNIALIGLSGLEAYGVRCMIHEEYDAKVERYIGLTDLQSLHDDYDGYVVGSDVFAANVDFFLPRKQKTLVVGRGIVQESNHGGILMMDAGSDETLLKKALGDMFRNLKDRDPQAGNLSVREIEVLRLISAGKINKEIADELCISVNTVITHRKNISSKLGIKSASGLSLYAMMNGII